VFLVGLTVFGLGSVLCSVAQDPGLLIGARVLQAVGGSMLNPVAMSIITNVFTNARERARAIGVWGGVIGLSLALGPVVGGALVDALSWRAVFWLNVPVVLAAVALTLRIVPESRAARSRRPDPAGQTLIALGLTALVFAVIEGGSLGWASPVILGSFAVAALAFVALPMVERRRAEPVLDPRFFRSIPFSGAVIGAVLGFSAMGGFLFLNTLYLQEVRGYSPLHAGLLTLPMAVATALLAPVSGRLVGSIGPRVPMVVAGIGISLSALLLLRLSVDTSVGYLLLAYALFGIGFGVLNAPITNAAVSGMPRDQAGVAAAVASTSRQVGTSLGVAVLPAVTLAALTGPLATGLPAASHVGWTVMLGCGLLLVVLAFVATSRAAHASRDRVAAELGA
ncbi:MFS transporter, partial [Lapillicoccus jejuensis]